jgi:hypothetical protein
VISLYDDLGHIVLSNEPWIAQTAGPYMVLIAGATWLANAASQVDASRSH